MIWSRWSALRRAHFNEVCIMISSWIVGEILIRAWSIFSWTRTCLILREVFIPENLIGWVVVLELRKIRRKVRHNILMMNITIDILNFVVEMFRQMHVTDSWASIVVNLNFSVGERSLNFHSCDFCKSSSQTMASSYNSGLGVLAEYILNLSINQWLNCQIVSIEPTMYFTS